MHFAPTAIDGVFRVELDVMSDERGFFARLHCEREFEAHGLATRAVQTSLSYTARRGTVRGLHFQWPPARESKLVRCLRGRIFDVVVDLRPGSASRGRHVAVELDGARRSALAIPPGVAHGFQTLEDGCEVLYQMSDFHAPALSAGVRWNDPAFGIAWPLPCALIHQRDAAYPDYDPAQFAREVEARGGWGGAP
jgi:dTDP-4-dehydrorhamnose 3,5-epimerase